MKDEDEILTPEDELEEDIMDLEEEEEQEEVKESPKESVPNVEKANETYEAFTQPARLGIVNTISGDVIEGFNPDKDEAIVQLGKAILNKLDKIGIASGV